MPSPCKIGSLNASKRKAAARNEAIRLSKLSGMIRNDVCHQGDDDIRLYKHNLGVKLMLVS